jgi:Rho-binding antiterminator
MGHIAGTCEFLDVLEEAAVTGRTVAITATAGRHFVDHVRDVVTENGQEWAIFRDHKTVPLKEILDARRAEPLEPTYDPKLR